MTKSGEFPKTVMLQKMTEAPADALGHKAKTYADLRKCAARIWTRSAAEIATVPAEFAVGSLRLLLRLAPRDMAVGWGLVYNGVAYNVIESEERDDDLLVTLEVRP